MREVIGQNGEHYRLHPHNWQIIQVQRGPGLRWRTHSRWQTDELARTELARLGRLQEDAPPVYDVTNWLDDDGVQNWSEDGQP